MIIVLTGVSGSGKTTIGRTLADALGWPFHDGDDYHPAANRAKMAAGIPLTDTDRRPWLDALRDLVVATRAAGADAIIACSGLARAHRDHLRQPGVMFVFLRSSPEILHARLQARRGHFFPPELLGSQLATLEEPRDAIVVDGDQPPAAVVREIRERLGLGPPGEAAGSCQPSS